MSEYIYHYTSTKALFGILKNKEFWWGNTSSMNDRRELLEFVARISEAVRSDFGETDPQKCDEFCTLLEKQRREEYPFAMCFSEKEEDASQWERYADGARGVYLKVNSDVFANLVAGCNVVFNNVYYDFDIRHHRYYPVLKSYFETGELNGRLGITSPSELVSDILASAPSYKNKSFWAECERRVYTMVGKEFCPLQGSYRYEYECKDNEIKKILKIRYDLLCLTHGINIDDIFEEIVIGPRSEQNIEELVEFCHDTGFPKLSENIRRSNCPLR